MHATVLRRLEAESRRRSTGAPCTIHDVRPHPRRAVRVRAEPVDLCRLPEVRRGVPRGEQPRPAHQSVVHPRARDGAGLHGHGARHVHYDHAVPAPGQVLHAGAVPAVREPAVHARVPRGGHVAGGRRHRGGGLQLVHRLPLLRGRVSLPRAPLQLDEAPEIPAEEINPDQGLPCRTASVRRA
jgi:hypothetical protein